MDQFDTRCTDMRTRVKRLLILDSYFFRNRVLKVLDKAEYDDDEKLHLT